MSKVDDLDPSMVLAAAAATEREARMVELRRLELAVQWCVLHPATAETGVATHNPDTTLPGVLGLDESLGGDGTPAVAAFTPEPFAAAMEMSPAAGAQLLADALDLTHRLPRLWPGSRRCTIPAWQARRAAQHTHQLSLEAARWVDDRLADRNGWGADHRGPAGRRRDREVRPRGTRETRGQGQGVLGRRTGPPRPDRVRRHQRAARPRRHPGPDQVLRPGLRHRPPAPRPRRPRRARRPQGQSVRRARRPRLWPGRPRPRGLVPTRRAGKVRLYLHVDADDLDQTAVGDVERLGPPPSPRSRTGSATPRSPSNPSSTWDAATPSTSTTHRPGCGRSSSSATGTACSPAAGSTPDPATRTTSTPTSTPATADHPAKPAQRTSPASADATTAPRPPASGDTNAPPTATATSGTDPTAGVPRHPHRHHHPAHKLTTTPRHTRPPCLMITTMPGVNTEPASDREPRSPAPR